MAEVVSFDDHKARRFMETALLGFYHDPPDSEHQRGYMCGIAVAYREGLDARPADNRISTVLNWAGMALDQGNDA